MRGQVSDAVRYALTRGQRPTWIDPAQQWIHRPPVEEWRRILPEPVATAETGPARGTRNRRDDQAGSARVANTRPYPPAPKGPAESRRS
jgi:hypothetical protein